jgi:hypothetical protein
MMTRHFMEDHFACNFNPVASDTLMVAVAGGRARPSRDTKPQWSKVFARQSIDPEQSHGPLEADPACARMG